MSDAGRSLMQALAAEQLSTAALYGIGHELDELADALRSDEHVIHVGTATIRGTFGVLALTDERLLWVAARPGGPVRGWPLDAIRVSTAAGSRRLEAYGAPLCSLASILPDETAEDLVKRLTEPQIRQPA